MELKKLKSIKISYLVFALFLGVVLMILSKSTSSDEDKNKLPKQQQKTAEVKNTVNAEEELREIIGDINGVTDVSVFITYENEGVKKTSSIYEKNISQDGNKNNETSRETSVSVKDGSGETPFVNENILPQVRGVIISAKGIKNPQLKASIIDAVSGVLGVPVHRVKILHKD